MKLLRIQIENFGTLQSFELSPTDGLNVLYQKNGWGKSTLAVFIKAMLYGLPASSKRSLDENERKKYTPWQGGAFGGSLEFETARGRFRVERFFGAKESGDSFALFDLATNKPSNAYSSALGVELFGIDADGFERSTYLSQRALSGGKDNNSISAKLGNLLDDVDDIGSFDTAMASLDKRRKFYVMTGNRGAVAEMEEELLAKQSELERCRRVEDAMRAQEAELSDHLTELHALQKTAKENRSRLAKAGLAREHAALMERKNGMLSELSVLTAQRDQADAFFGGIIPTVDELMENRRLLEEINNDKVRLSSLKANPAEEEALAKSRERFAKGVPSAKAFEAADRDLETLLELRTRCEALEHRITEDTADTRFSQGIPSKTSLDAAFASLSKIDALQRSVDGFSKAKPPQKISPALLPTAISLTVLGAVSIVCASLPALAAFMIPFLVFSALCLIGDTVLFFVFRKQRDGAQRQEQELQKKLSEWKSLIAREKQSVSALLERFRMPTEDLARSLTELSLLADRHREHAEKQQRLEAELLRLRQLRNEIVTKLHAWLSPYFDALAKKEDYRAEINTLQKEVLLLQRLESDERERTEQRTATEERLQSLKQQLLPFLRRYDKRKEWTAAECLDRVGDQLAERRRLVREIEQKTAELRAFVAEKQLDAVTDVETPDTYDRLTQEERLLQERTTELQGRCATLKSHVEQLSVDADRVPDLEAELALLKERLAEAKANAATITHTAKLLEEAKTALSTRYLNGMQESFRTFLQSLTNEQAPESVMDTSFEIRMREGGQSRTMESFSRGQRDTVELCVRLSLTEALYDEGEVPFLLLDDPFVNLDDEHLLAARTLLDRLAQKYQILYFVCHKERI